MAVNLVQGINGKDVVLMTVVMGNRVEKPCVSFKLMLILLWKILGQGSQDCVVVAGSAPDQIRMSRWDPI